VWLAWPAHHTAWLIFRAEHGIGPLAARRVVQTGGHGHRSGQGQAPQRRPPPCRRGGARQRMVEGAVGMVCLALQRLDEEGVVELDEERKAAVVSNLLVVLCSEQATQQVVNTGSLWQ